ncbi:MAG: adenylate/guanylate cyclase domain-containing protein [Chrysiogenetes bacterium]|nr:adenylate/guanylate cyclase domain-containing protein [Chrysiogenetes bacterium]
MSETTRDPAAIAVPIPVDAETGKDCPLAFALGARAIGWTRLQRIIGAASEEVRGTLDEVERRRTMQLQTFRVFAYALNVIISLVFLKVVSWFVLVPATFTLVNVGFYYVLRRTSWFRICNAILFLIDVEVTMFSIWQFGPVMYHSLLFLPILVIAAVFYLPSHWAVVMTVLMSLDYALLSFGQWSGWIPPGHIGASLGLGNGLYSGPHAGLLLQTSIVGTIFFLGGMHVFAREILGLFRQREFEVAQANELIRRYVPSQLAEQILSGEHSTAVSHERRKLTVFFSDIKGFTETADQLESEDLSRILNEYLSAMSDIAGEFGGTIDKFVGDAIMIFFGAPHATTDKDHALRAVRMAMKMQARMDELANKWYNEGIQAPFDIRIGINTGTATVGDFGSDGRMDYTAIGNQVNLAARLESECKPGKILISHSTWALVREEIPCIEGGEINVKGIHYPVKVYEVA